VLQAELNGETAPENAEILFHYGRSLFKVGQSKSDVLGGSAPATEKKKPASKAKANGQSKPVKPTEAKTEEEKVTQEGAAIVAADKDGESSKDDTADKKAAENKPLFQFTGDENFDDSDDDEVG
jgi:HAT1-interacting factor 1